MASLRDCWQNGTIIPVTRAAAACTSSGPVERIPTPKIAKVSQCSSTWIFKQAMEDEEGHVRTRLTAACHHLNVN